VDNLPIDVMTLQLVGNAKGVACLIVALDARFPGLGERLTEPHDEMRCWLNAFVDGEDVRVLKGMETALRPDAEIYIVPSVAGGL
jgi:molybdopterin converting factor small subunit